MLRFETMAKVSSKAHMKDHMSQRKRAHAGTTTQTWRSSVECMLMTMTMQYCGVEVLYGVGRRVLEV